MFNSPFGNPPTQRLCKVLKTGQTTQYNSELDDGYYQKGTGRSYTILTTGAQSGTTNVDLAHLVDTGISFDAASKEIRCAGKCGVFKAGGGETIVVTGSASNNATFTTASATADKVVLTTAPTNENAGASITIAKREAISNNIVIDNRTGLQWLRYANTKFGTGGNGLIPWTGVIYDIFDYCALCNTLSLGGYNDWRIPNRFELLTITNAEAPSGIPDSTAFPTWPSGYAFWNSTTNPSDTTKAEYSTMSPNITLGTGVKNTTFCKCILVRGK